MLLILSLILCACVSDAKSADIDKSFTYHTGVVDCGFKHQGYINLKNFLNCEKDIRKSLSGLTQKELDALDKEIHKKLRFDKTAYSQMEEAVKKIGMSYTNCF